jgi:hypothetical protein
LKSFDCNYIQYVIVEISITASNSGHANYTVNLVWRARSGFVAIDRLPASDRSAMLHVGSTRGDIVLLEAEALSPPASAAAAATSATNN